MRLSKKALSKISLLSVYEPILEQLGFDYDFDSPPDMWSESQTKIFDLVTQIEENLKKEIINTLTT